MPKHMQREIEIIKQSILSLGALVEESVRSAVRAFLERKPDLARRVIEDDARIDQREVEVEEECLKVLALYQPVAADLRFIIAILKLNSDLERIGDLAVNIAESALDLASSPSVTPSSLFDTMSAKVQTMLAHSLDALVNQNAALAHEIRMADDEVDAIKREFHDRAHEQIRGNPALARQLLDEVSVAHQLERIADHATNIAEDVVYVVEGQIVRHRPEAG